MRANRQFPYCGVAYRVRWSRQPSVSLHSRLTRLTKQLCRPRWRQRHQSQTLSPPAFGGSAEQCPCYAVWVGTPATPRHQRWRQLGQSSSGLLPSVWRPRTRSAGATGRTALALSAASKQRRRYRPHSALVSSSYLTICPYSLKYVTVGRSGCRTGRRMRAGGDGLEWCWKMKFLLR